jgi:hypothetical protein
MNEDRRIGGLRAYEFGTMLVYTMPGSVISPITRVLLAFESPWRQCAKILGVVPFAAN